MSIDVSAGKIDQAEIDLSPRVAEEIRVLMTRRRMSGRELARKLGVSPAWVSYRLTGVQPIDLNDLQRIAIALGVGPVNLIPASAGGSPAGEGMIPRPERDDAARRRAGGDPIGRYHAGAASRPSDRRPPGRPVMGRPPAGPGRTTRVQRPIAA